MLVNKNFIAIIVLRILARNCRLVLKVPIKQFGIGGFFIEDVVEDGSILLQEADFYFYILINRKLVNYHIKMPLMFLTFLDMSTLRITAMSDNYD